MRFAFLPTIAFLIAALPASGDLLPCDETLFDFEVEDQFEDEHTERDLLGTVSIVVWADREASTWSEEWSELLVAALRGQVEGGLVQVRGWAHTRGAPFFVKGRIRGRYSDDPDAWTFLDWDGVFAERYAPREKHVNAYVFDREGCLVAVETGQEADPMKIARLADAAQDVLVRDLESPR